MKILIRTTALFLALGAVGAAQAHKAWLLPSATVVQTGQWVTVDAAVSNDLFNFNHVPLRLENLRITAPTGQTLEPSSPHTGHYRSVFDLELSTPGTYRIATASSGLMATWTEQGETRRWRGAPAAFEAQVPADATDLAVVQTAMRVETFVTAGAPDRVALKPTGAGLELLPESHPNDLFAGEEARFSLHIDGQPAAGVAVEVVRGGTRYRNAQQEIRLTTDAQGAFAVTWPEPGPYWLEAVVEDDHPTHPKAGKRRATYVATFEVLPQ